MTHVAPMGGKSSGHVGISNSRVCSQNANVSPNLVQCKKLQTMHWNDARQQSLIGNSFLSWLVTYSRVYIVAYSALASIRRVCVATISCKTQSCGYLCRGLEFLHGRILDEAVRVAPIRYPIGHWQHPSQQSAARAGGRGQVASSIPLEILPMHLLSKPPLQFPLH